MKPPPTDWLTELAEKSWPERPAVRLLRAILHRTLARLIVGAVAGAVIGPLALLAALSFDRGGASLSPDRIKILLVFSGVMALFFAGAADFMYTYFRFLDRQGVGGRRPRPGKIPKSWDDEFDGLAAGRPPSWDTADREDTDGR